MYKIFKRVIMGLLAILAAISLVFIMVTLSGSPAAMMAGEYASPEAIAEINAKYGFDQPIYKQYVIFMLRMLSGDFPMSIRTSQDSFEIVLTALQNTLFISALGVLIGTLLGLAAGYISVFSKNKFANFYLIKIVSVFQAVPAFLMALFLIFIFSLSLRWLPTSGSGTARHFIMPVAVLSLYILPGIARLFRSNILATMKLPHVRTAQVKGLSERTINIRHVALNALPPVIAFIGLKLGGIVGGATIVEYVFAWPGVGQLLVHSLLMRDYPLVLASVIFVSMAFVLSTILVDIIVYYLDPRSRAK